VRRGFKAEAERHAARIRNELDLAPDARIDLSSLALHIGVEIISAAELVPLEELEELERLQPRCFSAATFHLPNKRTVVVTNPVGSSTARHVSDVAHEVAHVLLSHEIRRVQRLGNFTFFDCDPDQEEEANWFAGCLLLPRPLLLRAARLGHSAEQVAELYGVSFEMARFRLNASGVYFQAKGARRTTSS